MLKGGTIYTFITAGAVYLVSACSTGDGGGSDSVDDSSESGTIGGETNSFTPSTLAVTLPTTLTNSEGGSSLRLQSSEGEPGASQSQGYWELTDKVRRIQIQLAELTMNNSLVDSVYTNDCGGDLSSGSCSVDDACAEVTETVISVLENSMGAEHFEGDSELGQMQDYLGTEICFENVTISTLTDNEEGYSYKAAITIDQNNSINQLWDEDRTKVKVIQKYKDDFSGESMGLGLQGTDSSGPVYSGSSTFVYDSAALIFKARNNYTYTFGNETDQGEEKFTIQSLDDKLDVNGVIIKGSFESEFGGNTWGMSMEGKVDNNGGFIRTQSSWSYYQVSSATISSSCTPFTDYWLYPSDTSSSDLTGDAIFMNQLGSFYCMEESTTLDGSFFYLYSQLPSDPTALVVAEASYPEYDENADPNDPNSWLPTVTISSISIASISAAPSTSYYCYEEQFTSEGSLEAWRSAEGNCDDTSLNWVGGDGTFGDEYFYDDSVDGAGFQEIKISISGVTESEIQTLSGMTDFLPTIFIAASGSNLASVEPYTPDFDALVLGMGWPMTPDAEASTTDLDNYQIDFWGSEDQVSGAEVYVETFDNSTGQFTFQQVSDATVSQVE